MPDVNTLLNAAIKLDNDINGNPRYYIPAYLFKKDGILFRPKYANKYRGKRYAEGWVYQSYSLENDLINSLNHTFN